MTGRPSKKTPAVCQEICERLSKGEPLAQICRDDHLPDRNTLYDWMADDADLSGHIARAREDGEDALSVQCLTIADEAPPVTPQGSTDSGHVAWQKVRIETRLKLLAKWNPKKWGDKVQTEHTGGIRVIPATPDDANL